MLEKLLAVLLQSKGALTAGVLVVSTTGVLVSGTVDGKAVNFTVTPLAQLSSDDDDEENACSAPAHVRNDALKALHEAWQGRRAELKDAAETAKDTAKDAGKVLVGLEGVVESAKQQLDAIRSDYARLMHERAEALLDQCEDNDEDGGVTFDLATLNTLREDLAKLVAEAEQKMGEPVTAAKAAIAQLPANARAASGESSDSGDSADSADSEDSGDSEDEDSRD